MVYFEVTEMAFPFSDNRSWNEKSAWREMWLTEERKVGCSWVEKGQRASESAKARMKFAYPGTGLHV